MSLDRLWFFVDELAPHPSTRSGVAALVRLTDEEGSADREAWAAALSDDPHGGMAAALELAAQLRSAELIEEPGENADRIVWRDDVVGPLMAHRDAVLERLSRAPVRERHETPHVRVEDPSTLRAEGLVKAYKRRRVVNEVDISVRQGEIVGLLGPNGAGKTTTFYMIVGLIAPNEGSVYLDGADLTGVPMYKRARMGVGYLAQEPSIFRKLTVEENVLAILETLGLSRREREERLETLLSELSIAHLRDNKAYSLSGGERRRLEITRALVQRPKFMLLDEPFAGIDPIAVNDIQQIVHDLKHRGIGVIISDHNVEQTLEIVDRAYIMYEGRIRVGGTVSELVWNDEVAEIYLGPILTERMRQRFPSPAPV